MTDLQTQVAAVARKHFGHEISTDEAIAHVKAIKVIVAADGISDTEQWAYRKAMETIGAPEEIMRACEEFDPTDAKIEDYLKDVPKGGRRARELIRGAVRVASADGYSATEREKVLEAAYLMGLEPKVVFAIEAMVAFEERIRDLGTRPFERALPRSRTYSWPPAGETSRRGQRRALAPMKAIPGGSASLHGWDSSAS